MKYCSNCGNQLMDEAVVCPKCGCSQQQGNAMSIEQQAQVPAESKGLSVCAMVFAFLVPIVGLILGIVGVVKYKEPQPKKVCIAAIIVSVVVWIISAVVMMSM